MRVGIIGLGVVGSALYKVLKSRGHYVIGYDKDESRSKSRFDDILTTEACFISVPTPTDLYGKQSHLALESVLKSLAAYDYKGVIAHKCTVLPGVTRRYAELLPNLRIIHFPEFLREKYAVQDFERAEIHMFSGKENDFRVIEPLFGNTTAAFFPEYESTEIAKYLHNCFLATKVSFLNEIYKVCEHFSVDYMPMVAAVCAYGGLGNTHIFVPGPDGKFGWGGMCFVKDTAALLTHAAELGIEMPTLIGAVATNIELRPSAYNGEEQVGVLGD